MFIFTLLASTNYTNEFVIKKFKNASKFVEYLKIHFRICILKWIRNKCTPSQASNIVLFSHSCQSVSVNFRSSPLHILLSSLVY